MAQDPRFADRPLRPSVGIDTRTTDTMNRKSTQNATMGANQGHGAPQSQSTQSQSNLAQRFYRVPRPDQMLQYAHTQYPSYSTDSSYYAYDTEHDATASELSVSGSDLSVQTQATSVASDITVSSPSKSSAQIEYISPTTTTRTSTSTGARGQQRVDMKRRPAPIAKRTVHFQILPGNKDAPSGQKLLQQSENSLRTQAEDLKAETERLRDHNSRLSKDLADVSKRLSTKELQTQDVEKSLKQERGTKEGLSKDLDRQRQIFDEFRNNYAVQKSTLQGIEQERDGLRKARAELQAKLSALMKESEERTKVQRRQETELTGKVTALEAVTAALEKQVALQNKEVKDLTADRDTERDKAKLFEAQANAFSQLEAQVNVVREERDILQTKLEKKSAEVETLTAAQATLTKEKSDLESTREELDSRVKELEIDKASLELDKDKLDEKIASLNTAVATFDSEKERLEQQRNEDLANKDSEIDQLSLDLEGNKIANIKLAKDKLDADTKLLSAQDDLIAAQTEVKQLQETNEFFTSEKDTMLKDLEHLREERNSLEETLKAPRVELEAELAEVKESLSTAEGKVTELQQCAAALESQKSQATANFEELKKKSKDLEQNNAKLMAEIEKRQGDKLVILNGELEEANKKLVEEKVSIEESNKSLQEEADKIPGLSQEKQDLSNQLEVTSKTLEETTVAHEATRAQLREFEALVNRLKSHTTKSRSSSRPRPKGHKRSASSSMVFVRSPTDRIGSLHVATKASISRAPSVSRGRALDS